MLWVHASNAARFEQSLQDIATRVKIAGVKDPTAYIPQLVYEWLCDEANGKWLLILDNVDDASFLVKAPDTTQGSSVTSAGNRIIRPLADYIPQCSHGSILVKSRSRDAAGELVERREMIGVGPMDHEDAVALFLKKSDGDTGLETASELVTALEFMPLAIVQAAAYISQRAPRYSISRYLEHFRKNDHKRTSLLNYADERLRRDREAKTQLSLLGSSPLITFARLGLQLRICSR